MNWPPNAEAALSDKGGPQKLPKTITPPKITTKARKVNAAPRRRL